MIEKSLLAGALCALGKMICRTSPVEVYKSLHITSADNGLTLTAFSPQEVLEYQLSCEVDSPVDVAVNFEAFRVAVRSCKAKTVSLKFAETHIFVGDELVEVIKCEFPKINRPVNGKVCNLSDDFVPLLAKAAPVVNRHECRRQLQGINLNDNGITVTNGKELLTIPYPGLETMTMPFPQALLATKTETQGTLTVWRDGKDSTYFELKAGAWTWTAKAFEGEYPNWRVIVPKAEARTHFISVAKNDLERVSNFLKTIPPEQPNTPIDLQMVDVNTLCFKAKDLELAVSAESNVEDDFTMCIDRDIILRLIALGHHRIEFFSNQTPFTGVGGCGTFVAMPLRHLAQVKPQMEEKKMEDVKTVVEQNTVPVVENANPLEDLAGSIEAFKSKLKIVFDEATLLSRKVKEAQLAQKQKERDFILAKRAIERIRMAI